MLWTHTAVTTLGIVVVALSVCNIFKSWPFRPEKVVAGCLGLATYLVPRAREELMLTWLAAMLKPWISWRKRYGCRGQMNLFLTVSTGRGIADCPISVFAIYRPWDFFELEKFLLILSRVGY